MSSPTPSDGGAVQYLTAASSTALRLLTFVFLRWDLPPLIWAAFLAYVPSFLYSLVHTSPYEVIEDEIDIVAKDNLHNGGSSEESDGELLADSKYAAKDTSPAQELDLSERVVVGEKGPRPIWTLLSGVPSPTSLPLTILTFLINLALVLMSADLIYRGRLFHPAHDLSMARVGFVSDSSAKILIREPDGARYPVTVSYRYADSPLTSSGASHDTSWKNAGMLDWLDESTDFTGSVELSNLLPDTKYQFAVSNDHDGSFVTSPKVGQISKRPGSTDEFTFLHSSCLKNGFPYKAFSHALRNPGLQSLAKLIPSLKAQFMVFLGDFIYIDVPRRQGGTAEDYRQHYRQVYASPDWEPAAKSLPWIHVYDDHEVANDWDCNTTGVFEAANDPYTHYHTSVNPPPARTSETYFSFKQGPASFFMLDTRRYRSPNDNTNGSDPVTGEPTKTILGEQQLSDLLAWLKQPEPSGVKWKILISSIPFTKNWWFGAQDTWRGYLGERQIILEAMWDVGLRGGVGVVVLSGDRHEFAATAFPPPPDGKLELTGLGNVAAALDPLARRPESAQLPPDQPLTNRKRWPLSATVHEFSASPLNMFYLPVRTYAESSTSDDYVSDVCIKYIPDGNSKFGAVSISNPPTSDQSILHYRLFVDGVEAWSYTLTTPPQVGGGGRAKDAIWG
ncbi:hypothetical protein MBLNU230_g0452t1 [Neophaeotheca triangularis]